LLVKGGRQRRRKPLDGFRHAKVNLTSQVGLSLTEKGTLGLKNTQYRNFDEIRVDSFSAGTGRGKKLANYKMQAPSCVERGKGPQRNWLTEGLLA